jgi:sarcosine oxidase
LDADVIVVGLGAMGSMAAWRLAARGARVLGFDRFQPPHAWGSSHGETRIIRSAYYEAPEYVPLVVRAFELWRALEAESETALLTMTGALSIGRPDAEEFAGALRSAREHGLAHEVLEPGQVAQRFPRHRLRPDELALVESAAGFLRPERAVGAALGRAGALGARLQLGVEAVRVDPGGAAVSVAAGGRVWRAPRAVVALGAWNQKGILPGFGVPLTVTRQSMLWFRAATPAVHSADLAPVFVQHVGAPLVPFAYGFPSIDGSTVKVGVAREGPGIDPDTVDRDPTPADARDAVEYVRGALPDLEPEPVRVTVCLQENSPDRHFLVGPLPDEPSVTVLAGFSGHGFKFASVLGEAAADFALRGGTDLPVAHLSPERFGAAAGGRP